MGLIKSALNSISGSLADTWKDYFVCDAMNNNTLLVKATKKGNKGLFSNEDSDVITDGSGVVVNEGQCALICESGLVLEAALEPGNYTFSSSESPSIFGSGFEGVKDTFKEMLSRFTYNGVATKNQRVYYVNTKEIMGNLFGTATPIPFRIIDRNIGLDLEASIRCNGEYSFKIVNPLLFYQEVSGNVSTTYTKDQLESQMRSELLTALQPALAKVAASGVRYSEVPAHTMELMDALNEQLNTRWNNLRGIKIVSLAINSLSLSKEDEETIKELQKASTLKDPSLMAANLASAQADALRDAANNPNGAAMAMMGVNMVGNGTANTIQAALSQAQANNNQAAATTWTCSCGTVNNGNFCTSCGKPKNAKKVCPTCNKEVDADSKFCPYCGVQL